MDIDHLTYEELLDLNRRIVERLKLLGELKTRTEMLNFRVGERVRFDAPGRGEVVGTLVRHNRKTVSIVDDEGGRWNVPPHLVSSAEKPPIKVIDIGDGETA